MRVVGWICRRWRMGIVWRFFFCCCLTVLGLSFGGDCSSLEGYILQTYFTTRKVLTESSFQDLLHDELSKFSCKLLPGDPNPPLTLSGLERHLIGEGSHRHLSSNIQLQIPPKLVSSFPLQSCKLVMIERLPSGVFADPFELDHLLHHGAYAGVAVFGDTNLELPSVSSNRSAVEIHTNFKHNISSGAMTELRIKIDLPLHARYAPLHESGYSEVEFGIPDLLVSCDMEGSSEKRSCLIVPSHDDGSNRLRTDDVVVWKIPCGVMSHTNVVSVVTFATAFVSTLVIVFASVLHSKPR